MSDARDDQLAPTVPDGATEVDATVADVATAPSTASDEEMPTRVGRYEIAAELGAGAMGVVYRARDPELDRVLAIKVIAARRGDSRARLLREAQAMAKVRHPNVVPIFDVGTLDEDGGEDGDRTNRAGIFVVMPLVAGGTLRAWMRKGPHPWRAVVDRFAAAGRGLAAAHAAGLVHRDFKPDNVLVADDGEIMVADFGLALAHDTVAEGLDSARSIETSSIAGTPAYMAPEQRAGGALDARSDQFSFCIAFWEGLFGERPGDARTRTVARSPLAKRSALRADGDAPAWLKAALERGLAADPASRWPSMTALLDHLRARQQRPRRVALALTAVVALGGAAAVTYAATGSEPVDPCAGAGEPVAKVWTPARRAAISKALRAIDAPYAASVADYVDAQFEKAARSFTAARVEACVATNVRGEQSPQLLDARINCLDQRLDGLDALATRLEHVDRKALDRAAQAVDHLDDVTGCADVVRMSAMPPLPVDAAARAAIRDVQRQFKAVDAEAKLGAVSPALVKKSEAVLAAARATERCPVIADGLRRHGSLLIDAASSRDELVAARAVVLDASVMADSCGADNNRYNALVLLAETGDQIGATAAEQAAAWDAAAATAARLNDPDLQAELLLLRAEAASAQQRIKDAVQLAARALEALRASRDPHAPAMLLNIGQILYEGGDAVTAEPVLQEAYDQGRRMYGASHPENANAAQLLAGLRADRGDNAGARALLESVLQIQRGAYGPTHRRVLITIVNLSMLRAQMGERGSARADLEAALPSIERVFGADHPLLAAALDGLVMASEDDPPSAIAYGRRAVAISLAASGEDSDDVTIRRGNLAEALMNAGAYGEAVDLLRTVLARDEHQLPPDAPRTNRCRVDLARALIGNHEPREALPLLARARSGFGKANDTAGATDADVVLADAHLALHDRRAADAAIDAILAAHPEANDGERTKALAWRDKHSR